MSGSVAVTRAIAVPGLLLLLIIATALSLLIGAKSLPASVVPGGTLRHLPERRLHHRARRATAAHPCRIAGGRSAWPCRGVNANPHPKPACRSRFAWRERRSQLCHCARRSAVWLLFRPGTTGDGFRWRAGGLVDCCLYRQPGRRAVKSGAFNLWRAWRWRRYWKG